MSVDKRDGSPTAFRAPQTSAQKGATDWPAKLQKAGLFTAFAGMGGTASIIPAIIPLTAHNANSPMQEYLGAIPALFFGLMTGVLLSTLLLRSLTVVAILSAGSVLQAAALLALTLAPGGPAFATGALAAGLGFGLCEASGSILARTLAEEQTAGLLSALTGTVAVVAALGPLLVAAGLLGQNAAPLLMAVALSHAATVALLLVTRRSVGERADAALPPQSPGSGKGRLFFLLAPVSAALFLYVGIETIFAGWSAVIPAEALALDATAAAAGTSVFWVLMAMGRYSTWFILKTRVTSSTVLIFACSAAALCLAAAGFLRHSHPAAALIMTGIAVICLGPMYSLVLGIALARVEVQDAKKAVGLLVACGAAGGAFIPASVLAFTPRPGSSGVFLVAAALAAAMLPLVIRPRHAHIHSPTP
ncbi:MFS transporter [Arthrobacter sulfonylureivorans]|uniref:MFS transporter n=1 Tax=Arthrobacter sulfonylureivorans TaxID=2486855 RepID=UPI0039E22542